MSYRVGIDIGGTFTDFALRTSDGVKLYKNLSTPEDRSQGVMTGLAALAEREGLTLADFLGRCDAIVHGTVLGDAVLVERDATILTGSSVGEGSIVQAGALVPEGKSFPARSVIAGTPGKVIRETTDDEVAATRRRARERQ